MPDIFQSLLFGKLSTADVIELKQPKYMGPYVFHVRQVKEMEGINYSKAVRSVLLFPKMCLKTASGCGGQIAHLSAFVYNVKTFI